MCLADFINIHWREITKVSVEVDLGVLRNYLRQFVESVGGTGVLCIERDRWVQTDQDARGEKGEARQGLFFCCNHRFSMVLSWTLIKSRGSKLPHPHLLMWNPYYVAHESAAKTNITHCLYFLSSKKRTLLQFITIARMKPPFCNQDTIILKPIQALSLTVR